MAYNDKQLSDGERGLFSLNGLTGFLIAVALLLSIVFLLGSSAVSVQHEQAQNYYKVHNPTEIKMIDTNNRSHGFVDAK